MHASMDTIDHRLTVALRSNKLEAQHNSGGNDRCCYDEGICLCALCLCSIFCAPGGSVEVWVYVAYRDLTYGVPEVLEK